MSARKPWPLGLRKEAGKPDDPFGGLTLSLSMIEAQGDAWWRCHELDRADGDPIQPLPGASTFRRSTDEFIRRFGYDHAHSFIAAVLRKDSIDEEHAALMANLEQRWGRKGLLLFAGFLAAHCAGHDYWHRRSS